MTVIDKKLKGQGIQPQPPQPKAPIPAPTPTPPVSKKSKKRSAESASSNEQPAKKKKLSANKAKQLNKALDVGGDVAEKKIIAAVQVVSKRGFDSIMPVLFRSMVKSIQAGKHCGLLDKLKNVMDAAKHEALRDLYQLMAKHPSQLKLDVYRGAQPLSVFFHNVPADLLTMVPSSLSHLQCNKYLLEAWMLTVSFTATPPTAEQFPLASMIWRYCSRDDIAQFVRCHVNGRFQPMMQLWAWLVANLGSSEIGKFCSSVPHLFKTAFQRSAPTLSENCLSEEVLEDAQKCRLLDCLQDASSVPQAMYQFLAGKKLSKSMEGYAALFMFVLFAKKHCESRGWDESALIECVTLDDNDHDRSIRLMEALFHFPIQDQKMQYFLQDLACAVAIGIQDDYHKTYKSIADMPKEITQRLLVFPCPTIVVADKKPDLQLILSPLNGNVVVWDQLLSPADDIQHLMASVSLGCVLRPRQMISLLKHCYKLKPNTPCTKSVLGRAAEHQELLCLIWKSVLIHALPPTPHSSQCYHPAKLINAVMKDEYMPEYLESGLSSVLTKYQNKKSWTDVVTLCLFHTLSMLVHISGENLGTDCFIEAKNQLIQFLEVLKKTTLQTGEPLHTLLATLYIADYQQEVVDGYDPAHFVFNCIWQRWLVTIAKKVRIQSPLVFALMMEDMDRVATCISRQSVLAVMNELATITVDAVKWQAQARDRLLNRLTDLLSLYLLPIVDDSFSAIVSSINRCMNMTGSGVFKDSNLLFLACSRFKATVVAKLFTYCIPLMCIRYMELKRLNAADHQAALLEMSTYIADRFRNGVPRMDTAAEVDALGCSCAILGRFPLFMARYGQGHELIAGRGLLEQVQFVETCIHYCPAELTDQLVENIACFLHYAYERGHKLQSKQVLAKLQALPAWRAVVELQE